MTRSERFFVGHVLLLLVALVSLSATPSFATGRLFEQPFALADPTVITGITVASDVDHDGIQDLVLMSPSVRVLRGNGDGTYQEIQSLSPAGVWPALADLNADLYPDLVWTIQGSPNTITVKLNNGDGTFGPELSIVASGRSMHLEDVTADGKRDMVYLESSNLRVRLGNGDGTFGAFANSYPTASNAQELEIADLNGDGKRDVVVINDTGVLSSYLGNGNGTFQPRLDLATSGSQDVALGDVNEDGKIDAVLGSNATSIYVLLGVGNGAFGAPTTLPSAAGPTFVAIADFDGDTHLDVAASHSMYMGTYFRYGVSTFPGNGNGTFDPPTFWDAAAMGTLIVADMDGNGSLDLLANNSLLPGNGDGTFGKVRRAATEAGPRRVALGDVDGDGDTDAVSANYTASSVTVALGNGDGTLGPPASYATGTSPNAIALGDLDHDSRLDIVTANNGTVSVLLGLAGGGFAPKSDIAIGSTAYDLQLADVNGDSHLDLVVGRVGAISVYLGVGNGTFPPPVNYSVMSASRALKLADMNGDGKLDILSFDAAGCHLCAGIYILVYLGDGLGNFTLFGPYNSIGAYGDGVLDVADLNRDAKLDVIAASSSAIRVFWGNGDGTIQAAAADIAIASSYILAGDLDADGFSDLLVAPQASGSETLRILYGDGTAAFPRREYLGAGLLPSGIAIGNMDPQTKPDIVVANQSGNDITVLLNRSTIVGVPPPGGVAIATLGLRGHPNPVRSRYVAELRLPRRQVTQVRVRDVAGRLVRTLHDGELPAGATSVAWNLSDARGRRVHSGLYIVEARSGDQRAESRLVVLR